MIAFLRFCKASLFFVYHFLRCTYNRVFQLDDLLSCKPQLHVGCGDVHFDDCVNIDIRPTRATDLVGNCVTLEGIPEGLVHAVYANAFLEHIFLNDRLTCLKSIRRILSPYGVMAITAIPDFKQLARAYLRGKPGLVGERFDLAAVYRYTHGNPEGAGDWMAQLHKSLFDLPTVLLLLKNSGFISYAIASYCFRTDPVSVSFLLVASPSRSTIQWNRKMIVALLGPLASDVRASSIRMVASSTG